ncbi:MAG: hypothetical protein NT067_01100 [Candidatus Diapherotrites archaeon]|nr:hypothetical protein [Candidatus Diapherotrites archaeon]
MILAALPAFAQNETPVVQATVKYDDALSVIEMPELKAMYGYPEPGTLPGNADLATEDGTGKTLFRQGLRSSNRKSFTAYIMTLIRTTRNRTGRHRIQTKISLH